MAWYLADGFMVGRSGKGREGCVVSVTKLVCKKDAEGVLGVLRYVPLPHYPLLCFAFSFFGEIRGRPLASDLLCCAVLICCADCVVGQAIRPMGSRFRTQRRFHVRDFHPLKSAKGGDADRAVRGHSGYGGA